MMGASVLAAELAAVGGDHTTAFVRYEAAIRAGADAGQKQARGAGPFLAPSSAAKSRLLLPLFVKISEGAANAGPLDAYPHLAGSPVRC